MKIENTELIVKATLVEEGLVEQVINIITGNSRLFDDETVVLMADAHKTTNDISNTTSIPVGFTMTLSKGLVPVDYVSADLYCGVSGYIIRDFIPSKSSLYFLKTIARDIFPVNRTLDQSSNCLTDLGTLGNGNHFIEIGVSGNDTLISVHSGSRNFGGNLFKKHRKIAVEHTKAYYHNQRLEALQNIPPQERQKYISSLPKVSSLPLLDTSLYPDYWDELASASEFAQKSRAKLIETVLKVLDIPSDALIEEVTSVHNYIDTSGDVPVLRKGSIQAKTGEKVIIPINMRDGIIVGIANTNEDVNYSLPHGAGRVLSRKAAFNDLNLGDFEEDMKDVISATVVQDTLDESPRAYKPLDTILGDISPYLLEYKIFKTIFNYKGI